MATKAEITDAQKRLKSIGFVVSVDGVLGDQTAGAVYQFKRGYSWGDRPNEFAKPSGYLGEVARERIAAVERNGGRCSKHFYYREAKSTGNGVIRLNYRLIRGAEEYRAKVGHGVNVVSLYRDPARNRAVGGASCSRHSNVCGNPGGDAMDVYPELSFESVKALRRFTGIGTVRSSGKVRHFDVRPGSVDNPTRWWY